MYSKSSHPVAIHWLDHMLAFLRKNKDVVIDFLYRYWTRVSQLNTLEFLFDFSGVEDDFYRAREFKFMFSF